LRSQVEHLKLRDPELMGPPHLQEDEDTRELEERVARMAGKEAGLFCASGTLVRLQSVPSSSVSSRSPNSLPQSNQLAIRTHLTLATPANVVTDSRAHVHVSEAGGISFHSQAPVHSVFCANGHHMTTEEVLDLCVVDEDVHCSMTRLVCVENTLSGSACSSGCSLSRSPGGPTDTPVPARAQ